MRHALALFLLLGPLAGAALAQGAPRSVGDCERIKGDLAYNQCLSLFGPAAKSLASGVTAAAAAAAAAIPRLPEPPSLGEVAEPAHRGRRGWTRRLRGGRQSAEFTVVSGGSRHYRRRRHR
ncbi:hypothetical protein [Methylobacterium platani]|uniref:Uncharacterized protein n=2 Tax=Methylobacterium platani TaxID=427683 RepID=A0A179SC06_9HYPH|nr:hypothetical protein [Methylobacterium platani]KMO13496.1 hypothetical protein SQ03_21640 [Methylobacterium platani JCM 14648]OAS24482.1 hypothetical protein A5481_13745 [Methylobacterium platani]